jgi:RND family efflux transporter MFP subunit
MNARTLTITGLVGVGLLGVTILQARGAASPGAHAPAARPIGPRSVAAEGRVITYPGDEVVVGAERSGRLIRVAVQEGQKVRKGELLAELESDELRAAADESRARVREAEAEVHLSELNLARRRELAEEKIVSVNDLDQATRDLDIAKARLETVRATLARQQAQLDKTRILAPIDGTVVARHVDGGQTIDSGAKVATVANLRRLRIDGEADEADSAGLVVGTPVVITNDGYPGRTWKGKIEEVSDSVTLRKLKPQDPGRPTDTRILSVKVAFAEPSPLKLGTTVELRIQPQR